MAEVVLTNHVTGETRSFPNTDEAYRFASSNPGWGIAASPAEVTANQKERAPSRFSITANDDPAAVFLQNALGDFSYDVKGTRDTGNVGPNGETITAIDFEVGIEAIPPQYRAMVNALVNTMPDIPFLPIGDVLLGAITSGMTGDKAVIGAMM